MQKTFRAAVIGCGGLGRIHTECVSKITGMDMAVYCDTNLEKAERLLEEFGGDYATDDAWRVFGDPQVDAVYIATLHDTHAEFCIRALEAGKHVLVEKPLALNVDDCLAVAATVQRTGRKLFTAFKMRYYELLWKAKELIPDPVLVTMQMMDNRWNNGAWANDPLKGGGNVLSQGVHSCDALRFVADCNPLEVYAVGGNYYQPNKLVDNLIAVFRFERNVSASWVQGDCNRPPFPSKFYMQLFAENKSVTLNSRLTTLTYSEAGKEPVLYTGQETGFMEENVAFHRCLAEDAPAPIDHIDGLYATLMVLQAFKSMESGRPEPVAALVDRVLKERSDNPPLHKSGTNFDKITIV